ncbi:MAG: hypothetical protein SFY66_22365 [Oculatellaceae cyanobacterium bins.114]|nr:hypothetical protein [Oculatellaceae cyanobacterium bins.114]
MKLFVIVLTGLLPLFVTSCTHSPFSPESAIDSQQLAFHCPKNTTPNDIQILGSRQNQGRAIILFKMFCYGQNLQDVNETYVVIGHSVLSWSELQWRLKGSGSESRKLQYWSAESGCVEIRGANVLMEGDFQSTPIVYGRIFSPNVKLVEAVLKDGRIFQDKGTNNFFAIFLPKQTFLHEIRVLGHDNQILDCYRSPSSSN